jgi:hypothetical protein
VDNPRRGFEIMKTPIAGSGSIQNALLRWRIVNPAAAAMRSRAARQICGPERLTREKTPQNA